jgi:hypothetical protein
MESIISLFLFKYASRAFTISELSEGINRDLNAITPIRLYEKPISNALNSSDATINIIKSEIPGEDDRYRIENTSEDNRRKIKAKFKDKINFLEEIGYHLVEILLDTNVGIQIPSFQQQLSNKLKVNIERDDLKVLLEKTLTGLITHNKSNSTYRLIKKSNYVIDCLNLNHLIRTQLDSGVSEIELLISNRKINNDLINRIKYRAEMFLESKHEYRDGQEELFANKSIISERIDSSDKSSIQEILGRYKTAINQHYMALEDRSMNLEARKTLILSFISERDIAKDEMFAWFSKNHESFKRYRNLLGEELYIEIYKYLENFTHKSSLIDKDIIEEINSDQVKEEQLIALINSTTCEDFKNEFPNLYELLPNSLFYSNIPTKEDFKANISNYEMRLEHAAIELDISVKEIKKAILCVKNDLDENSDWELIYNCFNRGIDEKDRSLSEAANMLMLYAKDPYSHFLSLLESAKDNISFEENPRFNDILTEVCRDNIVTPAERELVFEKAAKFGGINLDKVELYLNNEFRNYPSFILLINEICEDGIVTEKEMKFIEEKASTYRIPASILNQLIENSLFKVKVFEQLKTYSDFKEIVLIYLLSQVFKIDDEFSFSFNNYISELKENEIDYSSSLGINKKLFLEKLLKHLNKLIGFDFFVQDRNLFDLLINWNLTLTDFDFNKVNVKSKAGFDINSSESYKKNLNTAFNDEAIVINNSVYNILRKNMPIHPLFFYQYNSLKMQNEVVINIGHPYYSIESDFLIKNVACSFIHTKNTMTSREAEIFINRFHQNLNLIQ